MAATQGWVFLLLVVSMTLFQAEAQITKSIVRVSNEVPDTIKVHCRGHDLGGDLDRGEWTIDARGTYEFNFFLDNAGNAHYSCTFTWLARTATFNAFEAIGGKITGCSHCLWSVRADGFYRAEIGNPATGPVYSWS